MKKLFLISSLVASSTFLTGCDSSDSVDLVDLDQVLDIFVLTAEMMPAPAEGETLTEADVNASMKEFATNYRTKLNDVPLMSQPVGVELQKDGTFLGFADPNDNNTKDSGEENLFQVEVDEPRKRLIASDMSNGYHRDHGFSRAGMGFLGGMLLGNMLSRQRASGISPNKHANTKMSPKGYHKSAVSKVRSARSSGGSKSFKSGK